jgi:hypothetical protein
MFFVSSPVSMHQTAPSAVTSIAWLTRPPATELLDLPLSIEVAEKAARVVAAPHRVVLADGEMRRGRAFGSGSDHG